MEIAIVDADLIGRRRHRFPNLCCMKLSGWHKERGDRVVLKTDLEHLTDFDKVYIAKVFTDTQIEPSVLTLPNVTFGGTGFFYDRAEPLPTEIEHHMPDYHLYEEWAAKQPARETKFYGEYSIGYLTRGCFRHCPFCINRASNKVKAASPLSEFLDPRRKKICLLDDNFLGHENWRERLLELQSTGKPFVFKQGLDIRLLTVEGAALLFRSRYDDQFYFAYDDVRDGAVIEEKMRLIPKSKRSHCRFYLLCGFDRRARYDEDFWLCDLSNLLFRLQFIKGFGSTPYVMRFDTVKSSPFKQVYTLISGWANQPHLFRNMSAAEFARLPSRENDRRHLDLFLRRHHAFRYWVQK